jgi:hypothetical protein
MICDLSLEQDYTDYFDLRNDALSYDDEEMLFSLEDALRSNLGIGFALLMIDASGSVTEAIEMGNPPIACAVDEFGRAHVLTQRIDGWAISVLDPRLNDGFEVLRIPYGTPSLISPHRLASGPDGSLYWDDVYGDETGDHWGIGRLASGTGSGIFTLGTAGSPSGEGAGVEWIYSEALDEFARQATALEVNDNGSVVVGYQDFPFDFLTDMSEEQLMSDDPPFSSMIMEVSRDGDLLRRGDLDVLIQPGCYVTDFIVDGTSTHALCAGTLLDSYIWNWSDSGEFTALGGPAFGGPILTSRTGRVDQGLSGWFIQQDGNNPLTQWLKISADYAISETNHRLEALNARLLETDPVSNTIFLTIDDGDIFRVDASTMMVDGVWHNRLPSGAPGHILSDAEFTTGGLAVLDVEHRAILKLSSEAFEELPLVSDQDVTDAISTIRTHLQDYYDSLGFYPLPSNGLLTTMLLPDEMALVEQSFLGGRIFQYTPSELGYTFVVWSAGIDQPVLLCDQSVEQVIF